MARIKPKSKNYYVNLKDKSGLTIKQTLDMYGIGKYWKKIRKRKMDNRFIGSGLSGYIWFNWDINGSLSEMEYTWWDNDSEDNQTYVIWERG